MQTIRVNRNAKIDLRTLPTGESIAVVDEFLKEPAALRAHALQHASEFVLPPKSYPGVVLGLDPDPMAEVYRFIRTSLSPHFSFLRGGASFQTMLSMTTLKGDQLSNLQRLCHTDPPTASGRRNYAFVLYLFDNPELGGTAFYRWKEKAAIIEATTLERESPEKALAFLADRFAFYRDAPAYITETNEIAEQLDVVPARYNRLLFYSGDIPHSAHIERQDLLSDDFEQGRLTLNCFASLRPGVS